MQPQHAIEPPREAADYPGRDKDCIAALRPSVADLSVASGEALPAALSGEMSADFAELIRRAEEAGWRKGEAEAAIRHLARQLEGTKGVILD